MTTPTPPPAPTAPTPAPSAPTTLTPAQRAAITRRQNQGLTTTPSGLPIQGKAARAPRAAGLVLELWITPGPTTLLDLSFRATDPDGKPMSAGLADSELGLDRLLWTAQAHDSGELVGFDTCTLATGPVWGLGALETVLPLMRRIDKLIALAREESEDTSLGFVAATLAAHFQVTRIKVQGRDGKVSEHKRGAAYVTAHKAGEALLAAQPKKKAA